MLVDKEAKNVRWSSDGREREKLAAKWNVDQVMDKQSCDKHLSNNLGAVWQMLEFSKVFHLVTN